MEETKLRQLFKNRADAYLNTIDESVEQGMSEDCFIKAVKEAINYTHSCTELKDKETLTFKEFVKTFIKTTVHNETYFYKNDEFNKIQKVKEIYNKKILNL